jgi:hypothetical protein
MGPLAPFRQPRAGDRLSPPMLRFLLRLFGRGRATRELPPESDRRPATSELPGGVPVTDARGSVVVRLWRAGPLVVLATSERAAAEAFASLAAHPDHAVREQARTALTEWRRDHPAPPDPRGSSVSAAELMQ